MADLTPNLEVYLSRGSIAESFHSPRSLSVSCFRVILGPLGPRFQSTYMSQAVLTAPSERSTCPYRFSHVLWSKVHSHRLLRAYLLGSKRKLPSPAYQVLVGLPSVVCRPRGVRFPVTVYILNQGPLSSDWAHCISCAPSACNRCRRCCCCPLQCDRRRIETRLNSAGGPGPCHRSWSSSFSSIASLQVKSLLTHSSSDSAMITRSSA